jgi:hypothetical protein
MSVVDEIEMPGFDQSKSVEISELTEPIMPKSDDGRSVEEIEDDVNETVLLGTLRNWHKQAKQKEKCFRMAAKFYGTWDSTLTYIAVGLAAVSAALSAFSVNTNSAIFKYMIFAVSSLAAFISTLISETKFKLKSDRCLSIANSYSGISRKIEGQVTRFNALNQDVNFSKLVNEILKEFKAIIAQNVMLPTIKPIRECAQGIIEDYDALFSIGKVRDKQEIIQQDELSRNGGLSIKLD